MASSEVTRFTVTLIFCFLLLSFRHVLVSATRPLIGELDQLPSSAFNENLIIQSLPRGPVPPSAGNPCTNIPGHNHGRCTLTEMNVVGGGRSVASHAPPRPPFSEFVVNFAAAASASAGGNIESADQQ